MENKIPRIVLIGVGGYGTLYVEEILRDVDAGICTFVGAADPAAETSPRYAELTARRIPVYPTPEALFEAQAADICCIAAPIQYHTPYTLLALRNGCHVLCEKPLSGDWKDTRLITDAAEKAGKVVLCGYQWSHSDAILALKRDIMNGRFGAPKHLSTRIFWPRSVEASLYSSICLKPSSPSSSIIVLLVMRSISDVPLEKLRNLQPYIMGGHAERI